MPRIFAVLLGSLLVGAGCSGGSPAVHANRLKERPLKGSGVLLVDPDVQLFEKTSAGEYNLRIDWTMAAEKPILQALVDQLNGRRLDLIAYEMPPRGSDRQKADLQVVKLHALASEAIRDHHLTSGNRLPSKEGRLDWTLGPGVQNLKGVRKADYVLFVSLRDSYTSSSGLAAIFSSEPTRAPNEQWGSASLVEKETGNIVWCSRLGREVKDLREEEPARQAVKALLERFPW